jgi:hypothetical protein
VIDRFVDIGGIDDHHCFIIQLKINNITQEKSEAVNQRRTDNAMAKRKKDKQANIDQQNIAQKTKDPATRTSLTTGMNLGAPDGSTVPVLLVATVVLFVLQTR